MRNLRAPVHIVIDATRNPANLAGLLEATRAAMHREDRLVVVTGADAPGPAPAALRGLETAPGGEGLIARLVSADPRPVIVVDGSAVVTSRTWLTELAGAVIDGAGCTAAAPRTNGAPWPQGPADAPPTDARRDAVRLTTQRCAREGTEPFPVDRLRGPCVALSAAAAAQAGTRRATPGEIGDALTAAATTVTVLPHVYVHATEGVPQISATMIVKNEADELVDCLASLRPLADEIVVYDTGSTDGSVELARSLGAVVIEGEWRNDFGWARNEALKAARGTWILSIDADERLELDPGVVPEIRGLLDDDPPVERFIIELFDLQGSVHAPVRSTSGVPMARLFRRRACQWVGALHEQPDARPGTPPVRSVLLPGVRYLHRGYLNEYVTGRNKWARNLEVAVAGLDRLPDSAKECFDLGRSLRSVGDHARAFTLFERAAQLSENLTITRGALEFAVLVLCETGQAGAVGPHLDRLRTLAGGEGPARYLEGWAHIHLQEWEQAVACFEGITDYDDNFTGFRAESVPLALSLAYRGLGRRREAADAAVETLCCNDQAVEAWAVLFDCADEDGDALRRVAGSLDLDRLVPLFAKFQHLSAEARDRLADAVWEVHPGNRVVLAAATQFTARLAPDRVFVWSQRLRSNGLAPLCALRAVADDGTRTVAERAEVLVRAVHELGADDLSDDLEKLIGLVHDSELVELLDLALASYPAAAGSVIVAGATSAARCLAIVEVLARRDFLDQALAVLAHSADLDGPGTRRHLATNPDLTRALRAAAEAAGRGDLGPVLAHAA